MKSPNSLYPIVLKKGSFGMPAAYTQYTLTVYGIERKASRHVGTLNGFVNKSLHNSLEQKSKEKEGKTGEKVGSYQILQSR